MTTRILMLGCVAAAAIGCGSDPERDKRHREIAVWAIEQGGGVYLNDSSTPVESAGKLPAESFTVRNISLNDTKVTDKQLEKLKHMTDLKGLSLHSTAVTDKGMEHLTALTSLEELELSNTRVTDKGVKTLAQIRSLKKLFLNQTAVTDAGVEAFKSDVPDCTVYRFR